MTRRNAFNRSGHRLDPESREILVDLIHADLLSVSTAARLAGISPAAVRALVGAQCRSRS